jgi:hypothetical protein
MQNAWKRWEKHNESLVKILDWRNPLWGFLFLSMKWDYVSDLRPQMGIFFIPQVIHEYGETCWNDSDRKNRRTLRKTVPVPLYQQKNPTWTEPGSNTDLRSERPATNQPDPWNGQGGWLILKCVFEVYCESFGRIKLFQDWIKQWDIVDTLMDREFL